MIKSLIFLCIIYFYSICYSQTIDSKSNLLVDSIEPYNLTVLPVQLNKIIYNSKMSELDTYVDTLNNLVLKNNSLSTTLKVGNDSVRILSVYPDIYFIRKDSLYRIDLRSSYLNTEVNSNYDYHPLGVKQYYRQLNKNASSQLVIKWREVKGATGCNYYYFGVKIIDLKNQVCILDVLCQESTEWMGSLDVNGNLRKGYSEGVKKNVEIYNSYIKINNVEYITSDSSSIEKREDDLNNIRPGLYKFIRGKFRLQK